LGKVARNSGAALGFWPTNMGDGFPYGRFDESPDEPNSRQIDAHPHDRF